MITFVMLVLLEAPSAVFKLTGSIGGVIIFGPEIVTAIREKRSEPMSQTDAGLNRFLPGMLSAWSPLSLIAGVAALVQGLDELGAALLLTALVMAVAGYRGGR